MTSTAMRTANAHLDKRKNKNAKSPTLAPAALPLSSGSMSPDIRSTSNSPTRRHFHQPSTTNCFANLGANGHKPFAAGPPYGPETASSSRQRASRPCAFDQDEDEDDMSASIREDDAAYTPHRKRRDPGLKGEAARKLSEGKHRVQRESEAYRERTSSSHADRKGKAPVRPAEQGHQHSRSNLSTTQVNTRARPPNSSTGRSSRNRDKKVASVNKNNARREKLNYGMGGGMMDIDEEDSDELSSLPDDYRDDAFSNQRNSKKRHHKRCSCQGKSHDHPPFERDAPPGGSAAIEEQSLIPAQILVKDAYGDDVFLPEGIDPRNVEDIFLETLPVPEGWSTDEEEEDVLFAALDELSDSAAANDSSDGTEDDRSDSGYSEDDDDDAMDDGYGLDSTSNLPLVLMEDWTGNLVLAQPVFGEETTKDSRSTSNSRSRRSGRGSKGSRSNKDSAAGSVTNGDAIALIVDAGAMDTEDAEADEESGDYDGDTTDSLPDEDMPSPPEIIPFSIATAGIQANNAAFGVTTIDEAALARDLGLPLADARHLLEAARIEEQQQLLGGVSNLSMSGGTDIEMHDGVGHAHVPDDAFTNVVADGMAIRSPISADLPPKSTTVQHAGLPIMGSFLQEAPHAGRVAVIDGSSKAAPSPFVKRGIARGRSKAKDRSGVKLRMLGGSPVPPSYRPRYSSVPANSRPMHSRSPIPPSFGRGRGSFDREDTPTDNELGDIPMSLDDVLDTDALRHYSPDLGSADASGYNSRQLSNLRRWERVPITTFRRSRNATDAYAMSPSPSNNPQMGPFRGTFSSPSMASTLAAGHLGPNGHPHGMIISPVLEAVQETPSRSRLSNKRADRIWSRTSSEKTKNRTVSLGSMPALDLGR